MDWKQRLSESVKCISSIEAGSPDVFFVHRCERPTLVQIQSMEATAISIRFHVLADGKTKVWNPGPRALKLLSKALGPNDPAAAIVGKTFRISRIDKRLSWEITEVKPTPKEAS